VTKLLVVGLGGFLGAVLRYVLSSLVHERFAGAFPLGTLAVNVLGCLGIGVAWTLIDARGLLSPDARLFVSVGVLGGLTTFSTFGLESVFLWREGEEALALLSIGANVVLGIGAVLLGRAAAQLLA
jgi:CrcB protein